MPSIAHIIRRRNNRKQRRQTAQTRNKLWALLIMVLLGIVIIVPLGSTLGIAGWLYWRALAVMPTQADTIYVDPAIGVTEFYDRAGEQQIYAVNDPLGNQRAWIDIETLPDDVLQATLQMEDPDFLEAATFNTVDTLARLWRYILDAGFARDTSLTGHLARNALLPLAGGHNLDDDLLHLAFASEINRRHSPREILEWHLNTNHYGNDAYGIEAAAQVYFGKSAADLTLDEAAMLAAIPPAPQFNPFDDENAARGRQLDLLRNLLANNHITQIAFSDATARLTPIRNIVDQTPATAPEFVIYARQQAEEILDWSGLNGAALVARGGLRITTTLDLDLYHQSECLMRAHLAQLRGQAPQTIPTRTGETCTGVEQLTPVSAANITALPDSGSLLLMDATTGEIHSMVGDVTETAHQPGPTLHPFVYFQGFLDGTFTPATMLLDIPQPFPGPADGLIYTPTNPDNNFRGPMNLRDAMAAHLLPPTVHVANTVSLSDVIGSAHFIGLNSLDRNNFDLSLLERGGRVSVLDMTYAYSVFAGLGVMHGVDTEPVARNFRALNPVAILQIEDNAGNVLWAYDDTQRNLSQRAIFDAELGYLINDILADSATRRDVLGIDDAVLNIDRPAAVINGVTSARADNWTIGYTPQFVLGVHLHRADERSLSIGTHGLEGAAPIWQALMRYVHARDRLPVNNWQRPNGVAEYTVCERSGLLPNGDCPTRSEIFLRNVYPYQEDTYWQAYEVNSQTRLLATTYTDTNLRIREVYFVPPPAAMDWWQSNGQPLPPTEYDTQGRPDLLRTVQISVPQDFDYVGGMVDIRGSLDANNMQFYQLAYGEGLNPAQWFNIGAPQTEFQAGRSLGQWDTSGLQDTIYTLQMGVTLQDNSRETAFVQVSVDNTPPQIALRTDEGNRGIYRFPAESVIPINAQVTDNLKIERVEFYHNGTLLGEDGDYPYGFEFPIQSAGTQNFRATAFDQVGNQASADLRVDVIRSG